MAKKRKCNLFLSIDCVVYRGDRKQLNLLFLKRYIRDKKLPASIFYYMDRNLEEVGLKSTTTARVFPPRNRFSYE
jgi:hypothetical protein